VVYGKTYYNARTKELRFGWEGEGLFWGRNTFPAKKTSCKRIQEQNHKRGKEGGNTDKRFFEEKDCAERVRKINGIKGGKELR